MKKNVAVLLLGIAMLVLAIGYIFRIPFIISTWPWQDGRLSYLFVGAIFAAISAAAFWIGWTDTVSALPAGALNVFIIAASSAVYFFTLVTKADRANLLPFALISALVALVSAAAFLWSRRQPARDDSLPTPLYVRISFGIYIVALVVVGSALILRRSIFPWGVNPDSSVLFGCIFIGDAFYFLYGLIYPRWQNALGPLLSFLAYDLVLLWPFVSLISTIKPEYKLNLILYLVVIIYSGAVSVYYLFVDARTRFFQKNPAK